MSPYEIVRAALHVADEQAGRSSQFAMYREALAALEEMRRDTERLEEQS